MSVLLPARSRRFRVLLLRQTVFFAVVCAVSWAVGARPHAQVANGRGWMIQTTDHFDIYYQASQRGRVDAVAHEAERAYARISFGLMHDLAESMPLILVSRDRDSPRNGAEANALVAESGAPFRDHLIVSAETFDRQPAEVLAHELTHQFVFDLLPHAERDAAWVSEALPDHYSGRWEPSDLMTLRDALTGRRVPAVESLTASDRLWGHAVFDFIAAEYGARGIRLYLSALGDGAISRTDAIRVAFRMPADSFNTAFQSYARTQLARN